MFFRLSQQNRCGSRFFMPQGTQAIPKLHPTKTQTLWEKPSANCKPRGDAKGKIPASRFPVPGNSSTNFPKKFIVVFENVLRTFRKTSSYFSRNFVEQFCELTGCKGTKFQGLQGIAGLKNAKPLSGRFKSAGTRDELESGNLRTPPKVSAKTFQGFMQNPGRIFKNLWDVFFHPPQKPFLPSQTTFFCIIYVYYKQIY